MVVIDVLGTGSPQPSRLFKPRTCQARGWGARARPPRPLRLRLLVTGLCGSPLRPRGARAEPVSCAGAGAGAAAVVEPLRSDVLSGKLLVCQAVEVSLLFRGGTHGPCGGRRLPPAPADGLSPLSPQLPIIMVVAFSMCIICLLMAGESARPMCPGPFCQGWTFPAQRAARASGSAQLGDPAQVPAWRGQARSAPRCSPRENTCSVAS